MTYFTHPRIGFACKWVNDTPKGIVSEPELNNKMTTVAWLNRQDRAVSEQKIRDLALSNIEAAKLLVERLGTLDRIRRMVRLGSDILPVYTEPNWSYVYRDTEFRKALEQGFAQIGASARSNSVRLSFHPGQFCVLASDKPDVVRRSIEEFEYHVDMVRWMGFGREFQDFKVNVHIAGRLGPEGIRAAFPRLSTEARNTITIENEEMTYGLDDCLTLADICPIVLDIHHHWIREGSYISPTDARINKIKDSWRGVRPVLHYSVSREDYLTDHLTEELPDMNTLLEQNYKKQKLRAHSDYYWNAAANRWALGFLDDFDIMCESKFKNLASFQLISSYQQPSSQQASSLQPA